MADASDMPRSPLGRLFRIEPGEAGGVVLSGVFFFLLLFGYFLIRPVREAMGVERSMDDLRTLFVGTCVLSLGVTLLFGSAVTNMDRSRFIPVALRVVVACLAIFAGVRASASGSLGVWPGYVFYVWLSMVALFLSSVFWAFMVDVWSLEQSKRVFPAIAIGGTAGALLGSLFAWQMAAEIGAVGQMLLAAGCFEAAVWAMRAVDRRAKKTAPEPGTGKRAMERPGDWSADGGAEASREAGLGGRWIDGAVAVARSPYLLAIGAWIVLMAISSTLIYFAQARLVTDASEELRDRISLFAQLDAWTQGATLLVQMFVTARLIRWIGVGGTLALMPIVTALGFAALAWANASLEAWQVFAVFAVFNASHRATRYAVARPARETLFAVLPIDQKYKAKPIVDVFVYRGGDVAGAWTDGLMAKLAIGLTGMALAAVPLAAVWGGLSVWLAVEQRRRARERNEPGAALRAAGEGVQA